MKDYMCMYIIISIRIYVFFFFVNHNFFFVTKNLKIYLDPGLRTSIRISSIPKFTLVLTFKYWLSAKSAQNLYKKNDRNRIYFIRKVSFLNHRHFKSQ